MTQSDPSNHNSDLGIHNPTVVAYSNSFLDQLTLGVFSGEIKDTRTLALVVVRLVMTAPPEVAALIHEELTRLVGESTSS